MNGNKNIKEILTRMAWKSNGASNLWSHSYNNSKVKDAEEEQRPAKGKTDIHDR